MKSTGRILHLLADAARIRAQLDGGDLGASPDGAVYAFGVDTDAMISGEACTLGYTPEVLGPHFLEGFLDVVGAEEVRRGGFQVVAAGEAYGSGSSRESAVVAHVGAGIELVVADSFQRIFQENMVYAGLPFSTDRGLLSRLVAGEQVDLGTVHAALPPLFREVASSGGLLAYGSRLVRGEVEPPYPIERAARPLNIAEKIIAGHVWRGTGGAEGIESVDPGDQVLVRADFRGMHEYTAAMVMALYRAAWGDAPIRDPAAVAAFEDHFALLGDERVPDEVRSARLAPAQRLAARMREACERAGVRLHGSGRAHPPGVCHRLVVEDYALPGDIVVLTDSHTSTAGVLNTFALGVGSTAMAFALLTGLVPVTVPKVVRVEVHGRIEPGLSAKDLILHLIGDPYFRTEQWRRSATDTCLIELGGPALAGWDVDELSVLTNMSVEGGLMTGILEPCRPIREFLAARRGIDVAERLVRPDPGARYERIIALDLAEVPITVASPGDPRNRAPLSAWAGLPVHNVFIGSCTGGSLADLRGAAAVLGGRQLADGVRMTVTPASGAVAEAAEREGLLEVFRRLGAAVTAPGCGACIGNGPGIPEPGETTLSTTNRNFSRRMGAPGPVFLVSPAVAAASAATGGLTDPRDLPRV